MNTIFTKTTPHLISIALGIVLFSCGPRTTTELTPVEHVPVQLAVARLKDYPVVHSFSGKLEAEKQTTLSTRIMGQVTHIYVKPGQKVKQGDLLLQIRNQDILAKKAQAEASKQEASTAFENIQKDLGRFEALHRAGSASDKEMDDIRTHFQMAKARLEAVAQMQKEVEESIRYTAIRAPYRGVITGKLIQEGDMANPGMPLLGIESPDKWKVVARIPEADIARLKLGDAVKVRFNAAEGTELSGIIAEINPSSVNTGNQFEAKVLLETPKEENARLYTGMYATVLYEHGTKPSLLIPESALIHHGQLTGLFAVGQNGNALLRWVNTGKENNGSIEILSGLADGETYVRSANGKLVDGALVVNQ